MNKQRLIFFVAVLCLAQLAVITSRQLQDRSSDLNSLVSQAQSLLAKARLMGKEAAKTATSSINEFTSSLPNTKSPGLTSSHQALNSQDIQAPTASRDPFVPFFSIRDRNRGGKTPAITDYELSELRLAAIISDSYGKRSASVEASDGKSFIVKVGSVIGDNGGEIKEITSSKIVISEPANLLAGNTTSEAPNTESERPVTKELALKTN